MEPIKITSLQVYRGIAAILVVLYHVTDQSQSKFGFIFLGNLFSFGFIGVDFFFVLSGFIILYVHNQDIGRQQKFKAYLTKRLIRLMPIYWSIASIKILAIYLLPGLAKSYEIGFWYAIKSYLLIPQENLPIIGVAWSLSYELLFYLLFGIAILVGSRLAYWLLTVWSVLIISYLFLNIINIPVIDNYLFLKFLVNERNLEFIIGCFAAYLILHRKIKYSRIIALTGSLLFAFWALYVYQGKEIISYTLTVGFAAFLLILGSASLEINKRVKVPDLLIFLGDASYSIYLTHVMFVNFLMIIFLRFQVISVIHPVLSSALIFVFALLGGSLVYIFLEKPLITSLRQRLTTPPQKQFRVLSERQ